MRARSRAKRSAEDERPDGWGPVGAPHKGGRQGHSLAPASWRES